MQKELFSPINVGYENRMAEIKWLILVSLCALIAQVKSVTFFNNVTLPSDVLTKILISATQNNKTFPKISVKNSPNDIYDSKKCVSGLNEIGSRFPSIDVAPFLDAWGKIPAGILLGHLQDLGSFDQCMRTSTVLNEFTGLVNGQYCFASVPLSEDMFEVPPMGHETRVQREFYSTIIKISIAICVPDTCPPSLVKSIIQETADEMFNGVLAGIEVDRCQTARKSDFKPINIVGIVIFSIFGVLLFLSTAYDVYTDCFKKPVVPLLLAFSVLTNGKKLFDISTKKSPNAIHCLTGMRVLSMVWVIFCHNYSLSPMLPLINIADLIDWFNLVSTMHVTMATVSVDTFFFISGLLLAWLGFRELDRNNGKLNVPLMYFHRYIRLTPPVAAVMLFLLSINHYVGSGPFKSVFEEFHNGCVSNWWSTLLYIQNYANPENICVAQTWYLAVDTQLYVLSPLILIPLWKWGKKFVPVMIALSILSVTSVIVTYFIKGYTQFMGVLEEDQMGLTYGPTHARLSVWLIAIGLGYFMHENRNNKMRPTKRMQLLGWTACLVLILAVIYGPYFTLNAGRPTTVFEAGVYESVKRVVWAISLSWIIFACHFGFGGIINTFLSHHCWQPMGRLTYSMYLVHMIVQSINYGTTRTDVYFSNYSLILLFWSTFGIALTASVVLTLTFEAPVLVIEKALLGATRRKPDSRNENISDKKSSII